jgi:uncharacterized protein (TIGR02996 family)
MTIPSPLQHGPHLSEFSQVIQAIDDEPLEMSWRLDFADWLERHGAAPRARWIRACCAVWDAILPLSMAAGIAAGPLVLAPWGVVDLTDSPATRWHELRPQYWTEIEGAVQTPYFGRIVLSASEEIGVRRIGETPWLPQARLEGWLESIWLRSAEGSQLQALLAWAQSHIKLPLHVDTTYSSSAGIDNGLMRDMLSWEGLHGLVLSPTEIRYPCVKRFAELATRLKCLQLLSLKTASTSVRVLEQLPQLKSLRSLTVGRKLPDDSSVGLLTQIPQLQTLRLYAEKITDAGLLQLAALKSLRTLDLDLPRVSRAGVYALREARPDLKVTVASDMRNRLGPV